MAVLNKVADMIKHSGVDWIAIATKLNFGDCVIHSILSNNEPTKQFVDSLTIRIWEDILKYFNMKSSIIDETIPGILQLAKILSNKKQPVDKQVQPSEEKCDNSQDIDVIHEISMIVADWKAFARVLGFSESYINDFEKFIEPSLTGDIFKRNSQRNKYLMNEALKILEEKNIKPDSTSWMFWRNYLQNFNNGREVIKEMERYFPKLLAEISIIPVHKATSSNMTYVGHPLQHESFQINENNAEIPVNVGSSSFQMIDLQQHSDWLETQERYMDVFNLFKDKVVFNFHDLEEYCPILNTLEQFINGTGGIGFATKGYHLVDHLKLFDQQFFLNDKNFENYFCFLGRDNVVINFIKCGKEPGHALHYSSQNIQIMNALHKELQSKDIIQVNVLVHNEDKGVAFCRGCLENNLFIKVDILTDMEKFKAWFKRLESLLFSLRKRMGRSTSSNEIVVESFKKDIITYEALLNTGAFPTFSNLPEDQMDEMPKIIFLTAVQFSILHGNNRHIILRGPYGSGKSIILRKKLDQCIQSMSQKELLYYICHDQQSKFLDFMRTIKEEHQSKSIVICSSKDMFFLEKPTLSSILSHILHFWKNKIVHIFVDEFSGSFITRKEILKLEGILQQFSNSTIVLSLQSMEEIVNEDMWNDIDLGYQYDLLENNTSFVICNLDYSLRCSAEINEFVKVTSKFIEVNKKCFTKIEHFFDNENKLFVDKELGLERNSQILENGAIETKHFYNISSKDGHSSCSGPVSIYSYDQFKEIRRRHIYEAPQGRTICHDFILIPIYITTLEYIINNASNNDKFVVCTFDRNLYNCIYNHFDNSNLYIWTSDMSKFIQAKAEFNILLTDYASVRGYEFSNFVFLLPMGTKYLKYRMIEVFTRATTKLHIITDNVEVSESSLDNKLVKLWKNLSCVEYFDCKYNESKDMLKIVQDGDVRYSKNEISDIQVDRCDKFPWILACEVPKEDEDFIDPKFIKDEEYLEHYPIPFNNGLHETLCYICETDNNTIFHEFIQLNKVDVQGYRCGYDVSENLLHIAARKGSFNITQLLISGKQIDIESCDKFGQTPLHCAVEGGHVKVVHLLIDCKANIRATNSKSRTPLHVAVKCQNDEVIKLSINNGANINAADIFGQTPLHVAVKCHNDEIIKLLINNGANINATDIFGRTPLHHAVLCCNDKAIKLLTEGQADINAKDEYGKTPFDYSYPWNELVILGRFQRVDLDNQTTI